MLGGPSDDTIEVFGGAGNNAGGGGVNAGEVDGQDGQDTITVQGGDTPAENPTGGTGSELRRISAGAGERETIVISGGIGGKGRGTANWGTVRGSPGPDTITLNGKNYGKGWVDGAEGDDVITVEGDNGGRAYPEAALRGGAGDDTITLIGDNYGEVDGGEGADTCAVEAGSGTVTCDS